MIEAEILDILSQVLATEAALLEADPKPIDVVHYKPLLYKDTRITRHKDVEAKDSEKVMFDWKSKVQLSNEYAEYRNQFLNMLSEF